MLAAHRRGAAAGERVVAGHSGPEPVQAALVAVRDRAAAVARAADPHVASAANVAAAETLGDELLKGCEHTPRHNRVVAAWVRAVQAARGAAHTRATAEAPAWITVVHYCSSLL